PRLYLRPDDLRLAPVAPEGPPPASGPHPAVSGHPLRLPRRAPVHQVQRPRRPDDLCRDGSDLADPAAARRRLRRGRPPNRRDPRRCQTGESRLKPDSFVTIPPYEEV